MTKLALFFKSHIDTFTRKDGSVVHAHDDKRQAKPKKDWRDEENWHTRTQMKMETHSDDELRYIHKDATDAALTGERSGFDSKKTGKYRDEAHYASMELKKRQDSKKPSAVKPRDLREISSQTHKDWKGAAQHKGKVNGWDLFHDDVQDHHVLMTPRSMARFGSESDAREWGSKNKANGKGHFAG